MYKDDLKPELTTLGDFNKPTKHTVSLQTKKSFDKLQYFDKNAAVQLVRYRIAH